ncbi:MAG: TMF family protein [Chitinophagaceae bacterium]|nr:TMF family protein [Chitinophagaceae bacterium]
MKKTSLLSLLFISIVSHAQWNSTVNSPAHFSASANGTVPFSIMQQRFNLPPSGGDNGSLAFAASDGQYSNGIGFLLGGNVASPLVWMYGFDDRNAFTIARKEYNPNPSEALVNGDLNPLMQVRANGYVGIGTTDPKSHLQIGSYSRFTNAMGNTYISRGWYYDGNNRSSTTDPSMIGLQNNGILFFANEGGTANQVYTPSVRMMIKSNGNIGIGTEAPDEKMVLQGGNLKIFSGGPEGSRLIWGGGTNGLQEYRARVGEDGSLEFFPSEGNAVALTLTQDRNIGIGTKNTRGYKLAVAGNMIVEKIKVKTYANWPDYVFDSSYALPSLKEIEAFIGKNKHLPGIPSAKNIREEGLDIADNQAALLQKIEELTLHLISQDKEKSEQRKKIDKQQEEIDQLKKQLTAIMQLIEKSNQQ